MNEIKEATAQLKRQRRKTNELVHYERFITSLRRDLIPSRHFTTKDQYHDLIVDIVFNLSELEDNIS